MSPHDTTTRSWNSKTGSDVTRGSHTVIRITRRQSESPWAWPYDAHRLWVSLGYMGRAGRRDIVSLKVLSNGLQRREDVNAFKMGCLSLWGVAYMHNWYKWACKWGRICAAAGGETQAFRGWWKQNRSQVARKSRSLIKVAVASSMVRLTRFGMTHVT